jgi:hypothetical protein
VYLSNKIYLNNQILFVKHFAVVALLLLTCLSVQAQKGSNFLKLHASAELTTGLFNEGYNTGWGVYATDYFGIAGKTSISLSTGFAAWNAKDADLKIGMSLTKLGLRQFLAGGLYFQADAGIAVGLKDWSGSTKFAYSAGAGYLIRLKHRGGIDISAKVNRAFIRTWIGVGAGYEFKL